ncbi:MAG: phosphoglucomutase/phosphomannomutase family protein [Candidatus Margulisiibacteriota bacterium]
MIKFGTDGWRAEIAGDFTFENVKRVAQAFSDHFSGSDGPVVIGYDNRFRSEDFAFAAANVVAANGFTAYICRTSCPTPAVSFQGKDKKACAGIMITASHNPAVWNGFKVKGPYGGSADETITKNIEKLIGKTVVKENAPQRKMIVFDPKETYISAVTKLIDIKKLVSFREKVLINPMFGSGIGYFSKALQGMPNINEVNAFRDPYFGGVNPEPIPVNLKAFMSACAKEKAFGIVLDGDADRIGAVGTDGIYINTHQIFALLLYHLVKNKKWTGAVVKTFNMSRLIDMMSERYGLKLFETPIGFKYICNLMREKDILMGGEESGGMGIKNHIPERDSLLAGLLLIELVACEKKSIGAVLQDISGEFARFYYDRIDLKIDYMDKDRIKKRLANEQPKNFADMHIDEVKALDGYKFMLSDGSWILFRLSGTEPLLRIYCEADSQEKVALLLSEGKNWIQS